MISFQKITNFPSKMLHTSRVIIVFKFLVRYVLSSGKKIHENVSPFLFSFRISSIMYVFFKPKIYYFSLVAVIVRLRVAEDETSHRPTSGRNVKGDGHYAKLIYRTTVASLCKRVIFG